MSRKIKQVKETIYDINIKMKTINKTQSEQIQKKKNWVNNKNYRQKNTRDGRDSQDLKTQ